MKKLYRSQTNSKIAGICGGLGELMDLDPTIVRLLVVIAALYTAIFPFAVGYIVGWILIPQGAPARKESA